MASHHHHQHQQNGDHHGHRRHSTTTTCCCCYCPPSSCSCFTPTLLCPPPPVASVTSATDPLLHTIALHLLQSTTPPLTQPQHFSPTPPHQQFQHQYYKTQVEEDPHQQTHLINSLLQRVAALEASSLNSSPSRPLNPTTHVSPQQSTLRKEATRKTGAKGGYVPVRVSLRDVAARTIQTQFRLYLVRRSQTLRHLKQLSIIRSHLGDLRSPSPRSVSDRVMDLLLRLDSIQSRDPMIREGKRSLGNELMRILDMAKMESLQQKNQLQTSSSEPVVMRSVSQTSSSDDVEEDDEEAEVEEVFVGGEEAEGKKMNDGIEVTAGVRYGLDSSSPSSSSSSLSNGRHVKNGNPHLGLFAPLPVKMEYHRKGELI